MVCLAAMPPMSLDLSAFEKATSLGRPAMQALQPQLAVADYGQVRLLVVLGQPSNQIQLEAPGNLDGDLCQRAGAEVIRQAAIHGGVRGVGFNGFARVTTDAQEQDPTLALLDTELINAGLGTAVTRAGVKVVYPIDDGLATLDISPLVEDNDQWLASINRHYQAIPDEDELARAFGWFADLNDGLVQIVRRLLNPTDAEAQHA
jgi:hypothetical protein